MANWCSNSVVFAADDETLQNICNLFTDIERKQQQDERYHLPSFIKRDGGYMQDIAVDKHRITFETRWTPNTETLLEIADFYKAVFVCKFHEMSMGIYGEARYDGNKLETVSLDREDFQAIRYDKQKNGYPCGEQVFEFEGDLLDYILEQKMLNKNSTPITVQQR
jgi:hypothetical protein